LFAPLTGLEVLTTRVEGRVLVVVVRLSVNLNAATIEQVLSNPLVATLVATLNRVRRGSDCD
jgi:hypothetical protein